MLVRRRDGMPLRIMIVECDNVRQAEYKVNKAYEKPYDIIKDIRFINPQTFVIFYEGGDLRGDDHPRFFD